MFAKTITQRAVVDVQPSGYASIYLYSSLPRKWLLPNGKGKVDEGK